MIRVLRHASNTVKKEYNYIVGKKIIIKNNNLNPKSQN